MDWWKDLKRPFLPINFHDSCSAHPKVCCCHFVLHFWLKLFVFESLSVWWSVVVRDEGKPLVCFFLVFLTFQPKFKCRNLILTWKIPCFILVTLSCPHTFISHACQCQHLQALGHYDGAKHLQYDSVWLYTNVSALYTLNSCLCSCTVRGVVFLLALQLPLLSEATVLVTGAVRSWISRNDWKMQDSKPVEKSTCYIPIRICDKILVSTHWKGGGFDDIRHVILELCASTILAAFLTTQGLLMKSTASNGRMLRGEETWWKLM